ncbi:MAG TPA: TIGR03557 family F420-dependent LLM class oxidoreductase [Candidatus Binatia bacterium]
MTIEIGYALSSEEHAPKDLVRYAQPAEETGFSFALISDHYHPWIPRQGQSPFVWSVIGAISQTTQRITIGTGVTCPVLRIHPAIIAQAAATAANMMEGRFFLGVGTGENLNEHILGRHWPPIHIRQEMLAEAVKVLRLLWRGGMSNHEGKYFTVEQAQLFTLPNKPPPILVAAAASRSAEFAGSIGDGLISTAPHENLVKKFRASDGGAEKPCFGQITVCWAPRLDEAKQIAHEWWPVAALPGKLMSQLATPSEFEAASQLLTQDEAAEALVVGPDPEVYLAGIESYRSAGFDHVYIHQVGPEQDGFFKFCEREILPKLH